MRDRWTARMERGRLRQKTNTETEREENGWRWANFSGLGASGDPKEGANSCGEEGRRAGAEIETIRKSNAGTNRAASSSTTLNTRKLDEETENVHHDRVPTELKKTIMQARMDKKLTQSQLAQMINEKPQIIQEYESGKAIANQQIISKLERVLGTKLRGKK
ncbi:hypothetical protein L6164_018350 [Bauhinia variegata]|uniref:Uncharacterized protein n=1 Tax=Bauhinia variegata TaxID=167791 RepID=A0ACB9NBN3_BAUVA|nr:hypothetical protein L6164_018350 [Bauhinia variegata]